MHDVSDLLQERVHSLLGVLLLLLELDAAGGELLDLSDSLIRVLLGNLELGYLLVGLVELGVHAVELPAGVAPLGVHGDNIVDVLHARESAALRLPDDLL